MTDQVTMQRNAIHTATGNMLERYIADLEAQRSQLMREWRANGKTDADWQKVEALDAVIAGQTAILLETYK